MLAQIRNNKLICDFDVDAKLEIENRDRWVKVEKVAFRSWSGKRRINGIEYTGPVYFFNTNDSRK